MKQKRGFLPVLISVGAGLIALLLRMQELRTGFDADGLPLSCSWRWILAGLSIAAAAAFALLVCRMEPRKGWKENFQLGVPGIAAATLAAACLMFCAAAELLSSLGSTATVAIWLLGVLGALCIFIGAAAGVQGKTAPLVVEMLPAVFLLVLLIVRFRHWSVDPVYADYCWNLFAMITATLTIFQRGGFCLDAGKRRMTAFWALAGTYFCMIAAIGGSLTDLLLYGGLALYQALTAVCVLGEKTEEQEPVK